MSPTYDFRGQVALVTGASSGMGLAAARAFAQAGAAVALADVNESALQSAIDDLARAGHRAMSVTCDVSDEDQVAATVEQAVAEFGRLDMAFNNAGIMVPPPALTRNRPSSSRQCGQPARRLGLHEARAAPDAHAGERGDRQQLLARRARRITAARRVPRHQARRHRTHQERSARIRAARRPHQRDLPRDDRDAHGREHDR